MNGYHGMQDMQGWFIDKNAYEERKEAARRESEKEEEKSSPRYNEVLDARGLLYQQWKINNPKSYDKDFCGFIGIPLDRWKYQKKQIRERNPEYVKSLKNSGGNII
jgi:hypothetical protein